MSEHQKLHFKLVSQEAAYWYFRICSEDLSRRCKSEFIAWARRSPEHIAEFLRMCEMDGTFKRDLQRFDRRDAVEIKDRLDWGAETELCLSLSYLRWIRRQYLIAKIALVTVAITGFVAWLMQHDPYFLSAASAALVTFLLLVCKERVMECRISKGFYGATESEVRDLIEFIVANADTIDFTDGHGAPRKCLAPESSPSSAQAHAVRAGVLSR